MADYRLAELQPEQHQALLDLEARLGVVLIAYRATEDGYNFEAAAELNYDPRQQNTGAPAETRERARRRRLHDRRRQS